VINSIRSERGWRGRRRIALLVFLVGVLGIISLGSAGTASAGFTACKGSVAPKSKGKPGSAAKLAFSCDTPFRSYGIASNRAITSYSNPPLVAGSPLSFFQCSTAAGRAGFGCGITNRNEPTDCERHQDTDPGPGTNNQITGPPCTQIIPANTPVTQDITLGTSPCKYKPKDPLLMFVIVGGEPVVTSFSTSGDQSTRGEYATEPFKLKLKGYSGCQSSGKSEKKGAKKAASGVDINPLTCSGKVEPKDPNKPSVDTRYSFSCSQNIRTFAIVSNKLIDFFGTEPEVSGPGTNSTPCVNPPAPSPPLTPQQCAEGESASHQCEGPFPSSGFGCGFPARTGNTSSTNTYPRRLSAGNTLTAELGFSASPCRREKGEAKLKVWVVAMNEPTVTPSGGGTPTTGEFLSEPFQLAVTGFGKGQCPKPNIKKKGGGKKK
jgi:hypothetical protein